MHSQPSTRAAKEFLIRCVVEEAKREGVSLTDVEREMLYFSETHWTLPNILEVNESFERDYNSADYERKITELIRGFKTRAQRDDRALLENWNESVHSIASEDHYLLVMIRAAGEASRTGHVMKVATFAVAGGIAALLITFAMLFIANR